VGSVGGVGTLTAEVLAIVERLEAASELALWTISRRRAIEAGLSSSAIHRLMTTGRWVRCCDGVYAVAGRDGGRFQETFARLTAAGPRAFARASTAAALHGKLDLDWDGTVDLATDRTGSGRLPRRNVPATHLTTVWGMRCTDVLQTVLDLACVLDAPRWEWALEAALRTRLVTVADIEAALAWPGRRDARAVEVVGLVLAGRPHGAPPTESLLETRFVQAVRDHGLPTPERQVWVAVSPTTRFRVDFAWPAQRFFVECIGGHHEKQRQRDADRALSILVHAGWAGAEVTWHQVVGTPRYTARRIAAILEARTPLAS
jgi:very-short-patch-repair endonuclease